MTTTQGNLASLSRFIFRAPRWYTSLGVSLVIAALAGVVAFDTSTHLLPWSDAFEGVFFIGIPTVVAAFGTTGVDRWFGGQLTSNRSALLALFCELVLVGLMLVAGLVAMVGPVDQTFVMHTLLAGLAGIFALRLIVVRAISRRSLLVATVPASLQTVTAGLLLFIYSGTIRYLEVGGPLSRRFLARAEKAPPELTLVAPKDFVLLSVLCVLYGLGVWVFLLAVDRPWQTSVGVSGLDFVGDFVAHVADGTGDLRDFFEEIGEEAVVPITVLSLRRPGGEEKARFVLPMIHPGPMDEIGGGDLPQRIAREADGIGFSPHATAGHDFNLVSDRELDTLLETADRAYRQIEYHDTASRSYRAEAGEATVLSQAFGDGLLLVSTFAPGFADDVFFGVGLSAASEARSGGFAEVLLVDAHNCNDGIEGKDDLGHVTPGSQRAFDLKDAAEDAASTLRDAEQHEFAFGVAWDPTDWGSAEGIGPQGVRVGIVEVDGQRTAYVLVDGNNMEPGLRAEIVDAVDGVDDVEVMTSDNHAVNRVESENQVGDIVPWDGLIDTVERLVDEALADLEPVEAGMASERAAVRVFGNDTTEMLASHANAVVSVGAVLAAALTLVSVSISALIFLLA